MMIKTLLATSLFMLSTLLSPDANAQQKPLKIADEYKVKVKASSPYGKSSPGYVFEHDFINAGSSYIKIHFASFDLAAGDYLEVIDMASGQSQVYSEGGKLVNGGEDVISEFWTGSVLGDHAKVRVWSNGATAHKGFLIDRVAYGYPESQLEQILTKSICGNDDKEQIICYNGTIRYTKGMAVCRVVINGSGLCTGWLIGSQGHVMTNNHCIGSPADALNTDFQFNYENGDCAGGSPTATDQVASTSTLICTDANLDYTLVQLPVNPTPTYGYLSLRPTPPTVGERIYIPQHPGGRRKEIAVNNDQQSSGLAEVTSAGNRVEYLCDTEGGSSGSPVISWNDNLVVALHNTGGCDNGGNRNNNIIADMGSCMPLNGVDSGTAPPATDFGSSINCLTVNFADLTTNNPGTWNWSFGDGNTSNVQSPTHTYASFGTYDVTLITSNTNGIDTLFIPNAITVAQDASPVVDSLYLCSASSIVLTAQGASTYDWFGDAAGANLLGSGAAYTTGILASDTTFYVGTTGPCASAMLTPLVVSVVGASAAPDSAFGAAGCDGDALVLSAFAGNDIIWYDQSTGGSPLATGAQFTTPALSNTTNYWVATGVPTFDIEQVGPLDGSIGGGGYQNFTNLLVFDAFADVTIQSVWVDAGSDGNRVISVLDASGATVASTTVFIPAGPSRINVNLSVPQGNNYEIGVTGTLIDLFRNNGGVSYPYNASNVEITGSTAGAAFYYYFYDWEVSTQSFCEGPRVQVSAIVNPNPVVSLSLIGTTMDAGSGYASYQWYWNGFAVSGATAQTYTALDNGSYYCIVSNANGCEATSNPLTITSVGIDEQFEEFGFSVWPNPVKDQLNVITGEANSRYSIYSIGGKLIKEGIVTDNVINVSEVASGTYLIRVFSSRGVFAQPLLVE